MVDAEITDSILYWGAEQDWETVPGILSWVLAEDLRAHTESN